MKVHLRKSVLITPTLLFVGRILIAQDVPLKNWAAPAWWSPPRAHGVTTLTDTNPLPFIAINPCRVADTRGNGFTGQYGPPALVANATRSFTIAGQCGVPVTAAAVSFNFLALNVSNTGDLRVFPAGGGLPLVSTLNYNANTPNIANAAVVPLGTGGAITVQADATSIDLIIDLNGYYYDSTLGSLGSGKYLGIAGSRNSGGIVIGSNSGSGSNTFGGDFSTSSTGAGSAGVRGMITGTGQQLYGLLGQSSTTGNDSAGVRGVDGTGSPGGTFTTSGVRGESSGGFGVLGVSAQPLGLVGVEGILVNGSGQTVAEGRLGYWSGVNFYGVFAATGDFGGTGLKYFVVPHPTDPGTIIRYISLEGPEAGTYFRGRARLEDREVVIEVPESFRLVTEEEGLSIQVTPVGAPASLWVKQIGLDRIVVRGPKDAEFFYIVNGVRKGYGSFEPISRSSEFVPASPSSHLPEGLSAETKRRLIANGTYNLDGTVNMDTADRMGWTRVWAAGAHREQPK
jgi:hypothetical protein